MKIRLGRISLAWLAVALVMFVVAVVLTMTITWTDRSRIPDPDQNKNKTASLFVGVFVPEGAPADGYAINYFEDSGASTGRLTLVIPAGATPVFVIGRHGEGVGVEGEVKCKTDTEPPPPGVNAPPTPDIKVESFDSGLGAVFRRITRGSSEYPGQVVCRISAASRTDTFSTRFIRFQSYDPTFEFTFAPSGEYVALADRFRGLNHVPEVRLEMSLRGAKNIRFDSDDAVGDEEIGETWRIYRPHGPLEIFWEDVYRQQYRDILLIVIGTLIGVGVTVMIEGLKPVIEALFGGEPGKPRRRRARPAPAQHAGKETRATSSAPQTPNSP